jgi:hopanoid-associated phosphorylase
LAERLVEQGATGLVSWGLAGGLDPEIAPGTLIVADQVVTATGAGYSTDEAWRQRILSALPLQVLAVEAPLLASDAVAATSQAKAALLCRYAAAAVDMESGGIARVASRYGLPLLVLRVVVDPAGMALPPAFAEAVDERGALRLSHLIKALARQPHMLRSLLELARNARSATSTLRRIAPVVTGGGALRLSAPRRGLSAPS